MGTTSRSSSRRGNWDELLNARILIRTPRIGRGSGVGLAGRCCCSFPMRISSNAPPLPEEVIRRGIAAARESAAAPAGSALLDRYEIVREISRGGQGIVYLARRRSDGTSVAIKALPADADPSAVLRLRAEAAVLRSLNHPRITAFHEVVTDASGGFLVMDYIQGVPFSELLDQMAGRPVTAAQLRRILGTLAEVCEIVHAAHAAGVIHRDLKPSNIRIDDDGRPHVLDFGLASHHLAPDSLQSAHTLTDRGQFVGSLLWSSPEQLRGEKPDARSDVWSLGLILHQIVTGNQAPFGAAASVPAIIAEAARGRVRLPEALVPAVAELGPRAERSVRGVLEHALSARPSDRTASAAVLAAQLRAIAATGDLAGDRVYSRATARRLGWVMCGLAAAALVAVVVLRVRREIPMLSPMREGEIRRVGLTYWTVRADKKFSWIPAGSAVLGYDPGLPRQGPAIRGDSPMREFTLETGLWMSRAEVLQVEFESLMGFNPSRFKSPYNPVDSVSYAEAEEYCRRLGERLGVEVRLPTSDEWEYAARAGAQTIFHFGNDLLLMRRYGNMADRSNAKLVDAAAYDDGEPFTCRPDLFILNDWGLSDMHGNVWEWCQAPYLADPRDPASAVEGMADTRGGSWHDGPAAADLAHRNPISVGSRVSTVGFRIIAGFDPPRD